MKKKNKGMALIMAIAIVGILSGIALTFAYNMRIDQKAAANYLYMVKARYLAEAGIARAIAELKNDAVSASWLISQIDRLYDSDLAEVWASGSTISGSTNGVLGEGYFDFRYARIGVEGYGISSMLYADAAQNRYLDETSNDKVNGHIINGIIDEERKVNINYANSTLLDGLPEIGPATYNAIIDNRLYNTITEILKVETPTDIGPDLLYGDDDGGTSWTNANNHTLDSTETDADPTSVLNGGIEDLVTVYNDSLLIVDNGTNTVPVNVNTAPETVLKAVISSLASGIPGLSDAERDRVVQAILDYRSGAAAGSDGNPNPFDGIDQNRNDGIDPNVSEFASDVIDNDGDGVADPTDTDEAYMFAGGPRGEFNALIDYVRSTGYNGGGTLSDIQDAIDIKDNADPAANVDYSGDGNPDNTVWTTSFIFDSKYFQIISTGVVERGGVKLAEQKLMQIVGPIE